MMPEYLTDCRSDEGAALSLLEELVSIDSGPGQPEGHDRVAEVGARALRSLGLDVAVERVGPGLPVVVGRTDRRDSEQMLLLGHLDTVFPRGTAATRPFTADADRLLGPGVADMKGGIVTMWTALRSLARHRALDGLGVTVMLNTDEEIGSTHSRPLIESLSAGARLALSFEPARPDGSLVTRRRGHRRFRVEVAGRAAHTGVDPHAGANAIVTVARWVEAVERIRPRIAADVTITVSLIEGGTSINTVPDRAVASIDVRVPDMGAADAVEEMLRGTEVDHIPGTSSRLVAFAERPPMVEVDGVEAITSAVEESARELGLTATFTWTGGGSDAGITASQGVPSVDGLGPVGGGYHTDQEFVLTDTLFERAALAAATIDRLARA